MRTAIDVLWARPERLPSPRESVEDVPDDEPTVINEPVAYVAAALTREVDELASTTKGSRNDTLNRAAFALGRLHGGGLPLDLDEAEARLYAACEANGYAQEHHDTVALIRRGLNDGDRSPVAWTPAPTIPKPLPFVVTGDGGGAVGLGGDVDNGWARVDLAGYLDGSLAPELPELLRRTDGEHLFYPGRVHWLSGEPEALKSWLAMLASAQQLALGNRVVYVDLEDTPRGVVERLRAMGVTDAQLTAHFVYLHPYGSLTEASRAGLLPLVEGAALLIVDACTEALAMQGLSPNEGVDIASWLALLPRWAAATGPAVLVLDHVVKNADNRGRFPIGSQHKLAGTDGVALILEVVQPGGRGMVGRSRLLLTKDRLGHVSGLARPMTGGRWLGDLVVDNKTAPQLVDVVVFPPSEHEQHFLPTVLMRRISDALAGAPGPLSVRAVLERVNGSSDKNVRQALAALVDGGYVVVESGPRNALLHRLVKPYAGDG